MKIEHIAMYVKDLEKTKEFFTKYFGGHANDGYHNKTTDFRSYFLTFEDGARLEIMTRPEVREKDELMPETKSNSKHINTINSVYPGYIHIAFSVGSIEQVNTLTRQLQTDGYEIISGPRTTGDGYYESCIIGIEGNQIEITI